MPLIFLWVRDSEVPLIGGSGGIASGGKGGGQGILHGSRLIQVGTKIINCPLLGVIILPKFRQGGSSIWLLIEVAEACCWHYDTILDNLLRDVYVLCHIGHINCIIY